MFGSLLNLVTNTAKIVAAPVELLIDAVDAVVEPVAEVVETLVDDIKSTLK